MKFEIEKNDIDIGTTPLENMFINTYLAIATSDQIKVYIFAYAHAYSNSTESLSNDMIAREMKLSVGQVIDAWDFWIKEGLVEEKDGAYIFKSLRHDYINQILNIGASRLEDRGFKLPDLEYLPSDRDTKELIENIEDFISTGSDVKIKLNRIEIEKILSYMDEFKASADFISYAFPLASSKRNTKSVHQVMETIRQWMIDGVSSEDKLNDYLEAKDRENPFQNNIKAGRTGKASKTKLDKDNRMSPEERRKFIREKINAKHSFKPREE